MSASSYTELPTDRRIKRTPQKDKVTEITQTSKAVHGTLSQDRQHPTAQPEGSAMSGRNQHTLSVCPCVEDKLNKTRKEVLPQPHLLLRRSSQSP